MSIVVVSVSVSPLYFICSVAWNRTVPSSNVLYVPLNVSANVRWLCVCVNVPSGRISRSDEYPSTTKPSGGYFHLPFISVCEFRSTHHPSATATRATKIRHVESWNFKVAKPHDRRRKLSGRWTSFTEISSDHKSQSLSKL